MMMILMMVMTLPACSAMETIYNIKFYMDQIIVCREKIANSVMLQITQVSYFVDFLAVIQLYMF